MEKRRCHELETKRRRIKHMRALHAIMRRKGSEARSLGRPREEDRSLIRVEREQHIYNLLEARGTEASGRVWEIMEEERSYELHGGRAVRANGTCGAYSALLN